MKDNSHTGEKSSERITKEKLSQSILSLIAFRALEKSMLLTHRLWRFFYSVSFNASIHQSISSRCVLLSRSLFAVACHFFLIMTIDSALLCVLAFFSFSHSLSLFLWMTNVTQHNDDIRLSIKKENPSALSTIHSCRFGSTEKLKVKRLDEIAYLTNQFS